MTIGTYLLDLIDENQDSDFNMVLFGENPSDDFKEDIYLVGQMFPCCNFYSAELIESDIEQLKDLHILFDYIVVTYLIDSNEKWKELHKLLDLSKEKGHIIIACPNSYNILKITDLIKYRCKGSEESKGENKDCSYIDIANNVTDFGLIIKKFGLFGETIDSQISSDILIKSLGDDYTDNINAIFLPYIRLSLMKIPSYPKDDAKTLFPDQDEGMEGYINEVNKFNIYNLVMRKSNEDNDYYMKYIEPVKKEVKFGREANELLKQKILEEKPFCALRLGNTEGMLIDNYIDRINGDKKGYSEFALEYAFNACGFFIEDASKEEKVTESLDDFVKIQLDGFKNADFMMTWGACRMEAVIANHFAPAWCDNISYFSLIPFVKEYEPWTSALKGKKVLVVTSVPDSIEYQYQRKNLISPYENSILPDFTLITYRMLQTCQGDDNGFANWFDALELVKKEILSIDFDIAIVGAGFYGVPICDAIKKSGRSAIEMCGLTSFIFGVAGKRFINDQRDYYGKYMTDAWIRPFDQKPSWYQQVEGGCYW